MCTQNMCEKCQKPQRVITDGHTFCKEHAVAYYEHILCKFKVKYDTANPRGAEKGKILEHQIKPTKQMIAWIIQNVRPD